MIVCKLHYYIKGNGVSGLSVSPFLFPSLSLSSGSLTQSFLVVIFDKIPVLGIFLILEFCSVSLPKLTSFLEHHVGDPLSFFSP